MRRAAGLLITLTLVAAACSGDDPQAAPTTTVTTTTVLETTTSTTTTTTLPVDPLTVPPARWPAAAGQDPLPATWVTVTDIGAEPLELLRYGGDGPDEDWGLTVRVSPFGVESPQTWSFTGTSDSRHDGLVITPRTLDVPAEKFALKLDAAGRVQILTPTGTTSPEKGTDLVDLLAAHLIPLPEEPVGVGGTWSPPQTGPFTLLPAPTYELLDFDGRLMTVRASGTSAGFDLAEPGATRGSFAPRTGTHDGVLTIDLQTGMVIGDRRVTGTIDAVDGPIEFDSSLSTEPAMALNSRGMPVALILESGSIWDGRTVGNETFTYVGTNLGKDDDWPMLNFSGAAAAVSSAFALGPKTYDGTPDDAWPGDAAGSMIRVMIDSVLPAFVGDVDLREPLPFGGAEQLYIADVGISGTSVPVVWEIEALEGGDVVVRIDSDFDQEDIHRGYRFGSVGNASGEFRVNRFNLMDIEGRIDIVFDVIDDDGSSELHQWWEASRAPEPPEPDEWNVGLNGIERFANVRDQGPLTVDDWVVPFGYGGGAWSGRFELEQFWSQIDRQQESTMIAAVVDVDSRFTTDGQWLTMVLQEWAPDGPMFTRLEDPPIDAPFALIVDGSGRIGDAYPSDAEEIASRNQRIWFGQLLQTTLPAFPEDPIGVGTTWQVHVQGEQDGAGPIYTVVEVDDGLLHLDVSGEFGLYIGDRYDGYTIVAELDGELIIDWAAGIPLQANIESIGTITFGEGGVPDPATTEPWRSSLDVLAVSDDE